MTTNKILLFLVTLLANMVPCFAMQRGEIILKELGTRKNPEFKAIMQDPISDREYGQIEYSIHGDKEKVAKIDMIHVEPRLRRNGYGKRLVNYAIDHFKSLGFSQVTLMATPHENYLKSQEERAQFQMQNLFNLIAFYQRLGGRVIAIVNNNKGASMTIPTTQPTQT